MKYSKKTVEKKFPELKNAVYRTTMELQSAVFECTKMRAELGRKQEQDQELKIHRNKYKNKLDEYARPRRDLDLKIRFFTDLLKAKEGEQPITIRPTPTQAPILEEMLNEVPF